MIFLEGLRGLQCVNRHRASPSTHVESASAFPEFRIHVSVFASVDLSQYLLPVSKCPEVDYKQSPPLNQQVCCTCLFRFYFHHQCLVHSATSPLPVHAESVFFLLG